MAMRSVLVHLADCTRSEVEAVLSRHYVRQNGQGLHAIGIDDAVLYISIYEGAPTECEPDELVRIQSALEGQAAVSVIADISGRRPGGPEVMKFVSLMLDRFAGVADDDHGGLCTLGEIRRDKLFNGRHFFGDAVCRVGVVSKRDVQAE